MTMEILFCKNYFTHSIHHKYILFLNAR